MNKLDNTWRLRALTRAKSLKGIPWTKREQEVIDAWEKAEPGFGIFMAFGITPERQSYINGTIEILEKEEEEWRGQLLIAAIRLKWSCEELLQ